MKNEKAEIVVEMQTTYIPEESTFSFDISEESSDSTIAEENNIFVKETMKIDKANNNFAYLWDVKNNNKYFLSMNFLKTGNTYGVYIPEVHDKYISLEDRDIKKIAKTFGVADEELEYFPDTIPKIFFTEEENTKMKEIALKYFENIFSQIDSTLYTKEKYSIDDFDGEKVQGNKYVLTISDTALDDIMTNTIKELEQDQEIVSLIEGNAIGILVNAIRIAQNAFANSMQNSIANWEQTTEESNSIILEKNENIVDNAESVEKKIEETPENIQICIYEHKGETIKIEFLTEDGTAIDFTINNKETSSHIVFKTIEPKTTTNDVGYETIIDISNKYENNNGEFVLSMKNEYNQNDIEDLKKENEEENSLMSAWYTDEYYAEKFKTKEMTCNITTTVNNEIINSKFTYDTSEITEDTAGNEFDMTMRFDQNLEINKLTDNNKLVVNDYSLEEFMALGKQIEENMSKSSKANPESLIGSMIKQQEEEKLETITYYKEYIYEDVKQSIEYNLSNYHMDASTDPNANPSDYLTLDKIKEEAGWRIDEMELVDGTTLKCVVNEYVFFVKINIDGGEWKLMDLTVLYSEDGTVENAQ